mmetsp:Transcript_246/g.407  ORF Transcript_246/g.407 Transcript_246/m.407 type:complete len:178 (-) Transcript_246:208-741(-)
MASLPLNYPNLHLMSITTSSIGHGDMPRGPDGFKLSQRCLDLAQEKIPEPYDFSLEEKVVNDLKKKKELSEQIAKDDAAATVEEAQAEERQSISTVEGDKAVEVTLLNLNIGISGDGAVRNSSVISDDIGEASNQAMVTKLMSITNASESQCRTYLEKTDYDLENAAAEYFASLSAR